MINIKYIDDLCDAKLINKKIVCHEDKYGTMWTNFYFKGELTDYLISNKGDLYSFKSKSIVNKRYDGTGHTICNINHKKHQYSIRMNRAVMISFHPIYNPELYVVNHKDGIPSNDDEDNLEWTTHYGNKIHAIKNGLIDNESERSINNRKLKYERMLQERKVYELIKDGYDNSYIYSVTKLPKHIITGIRNGNSFSNYTENDIRNVCELLVKKIPQKEISKITGVSFREIRRILDMDSWRYIYYEYKDKIKRNVSVNKEEKRKVKELVDSGKKYKDILDILGLSDCRHSRYLYETATSKKYFGKGSTTRES